MLHISENIKLIRELSGKSQADFGQKFDATKAMIVSYEKGKAKPGGLFIQRLSKHTGVSEDALINSKIREENVEKEKLEKLFQGETVPGETNDKGRLHQDVGDPTDYKKLYIELLKKENDEKTNVIKENLNVIQASLRGLLFQSASILAHVSTSLEKDDEREAAGNKGKLQQLKTDTGKRIADRLQVHQNKSNHTNGR